MTANLKRAASYVGRLHPHSNQKDRGLNVMNNYSESNQVVSKPAVDVYELQKQLNQALGTIERLEKERLTIQFMIEQANAARDDYSQRYQESLQELDNKDTTITWLQEQNETLTSTREYLTNEREWMRGILYNATMNPTQKVVLMSSYDHAKSGEKTRIFTGTKAKQTGVHRQTYGGTLHGLAELGIIDRDEDTKKNAKGKNETEVVIKFSEELLRFPGEIHIEKEDKRKGNGKDGGKNAKPKQCPECKSVQVDELDKCRCRKCNHEWEDGPAKDANRNSKVTPWEYGEVEEDTAELTKDIEATKLDETTSTENVAPHPIINTLFPEIVTTSGDMAPAAGASTVTPNVTTVTDMAPKPPLPHPLCHPSAGWNYDGLFEKWFCEVCNHG